MNNLPRYCCCRLSLLDRNRLYRLSGVSRCTRSSPDSAWLPTVLPYSLSSDRRDIVSLSERSSAASSTLLFYSPAAQQNSAEEAERRPKLQRLHPLSASHCFHWELHHRSLFHSTHPSASNRQALSHSPPVCAPSRRESD